LIPRLTRIASSLAAVIVLYWVYALVAVPFIEPAAAEHNASAVSDDDVVSAERHMQSASEQQAKALGMWFRKGDWELTVPKILETAQGMLLVKNYRNLGEGKVEIRPCTMIFLPEGNFDNEEDRQRRAIIVRSPEGAILQFDASVDIKQAKVGKPRAGKLMGPVTIHSDQRDPGPQDDLLIKTRDVDLSEQQLWTAQPVDFQLGPNYGHGRAMQIDMAPQGSKRGFRGMTLLQLSEHVEMHIHPSNNRGMPGQKPATAGESKPSPPVEIRCRGPFRFDFLKNLATFQDHVDVLRINPSGPSDQLTCQLLSIFFEATTPKPGVPANDKTASNLQAVRAEAVGNPVTVHGPSNDFSARGQQIEYDLKTGGVTLHGHEEVELSQHGRVIHSREVFFQPDAAGRVGRFIALGHGWLNGTSPDNPNQQIEARWTRRLHFRPHESNHLLSVEGDAHLHMVGRGVLDAEEIHFWLIDAPASANSAPGKMEFIPDRLMAIGHVKIDSPQMTGAVGQLQAWFEQVKGLARSMAASKPAAAPAAPSGMVTPQPPALPATMQPAAESLGPPPQADRPPAASPSLVSGPVLTPRGVQAPASPPAAPAGEPIAPGTIAAPPQAVPASPPLEGLPPQSRFNVDGELLRVRIQIEGPVTRVSEVIVEHNVKLRETQTRAPGEKPLLIVGQQLHALMPQPDAALVTVVGQPGYIEARGMTLTSEKIHMDRAQNTLWTDSHGLMTVPVDRDLDGKHVAEPQKLEVTWQGHMHFDGQVARFYRQVLAQQGPRALRTEMLEAMFSSPVALGAKAPQTRPEIERITCTQGAFLENRTLEGPKLMSIDYLFAAELRLHQPTGDVSGVGPGWLRSVRVDNGDHKLALPGGPPAAAQSPKRPPGAEGLSYLAVRFERGLIGNLRRKEMTFENQVRTVYGPVATWDGQLDPDRPETWGEQGVMLTSERLSVAEVPTGKQDEHSYELEATGNTVVENTMFTARSARLTYAQAKDLLILEGNGRTDARLFRQVRNGAVPSEAAARKILFWPSTNRVEVDKVQMLDLTNPPSAVPTKR
jgi:lipopolysaccharide export system protein LptA